MNQPFRRFMSFNSDSLFAWMSLYAAVLVAIIGTFLLFTYQDIEVETSYKATLHQMFQVERAAAENRFLAQTTAALKSQANRASRFKRQVKDLTAILGDKEAAATQALVRKGYVIPALPETKKSLGAETLADLKATVALEGTRVETDTKPCQDLPGFLNKLT